MKSTAKVTHTPENGAEKKWTIKDDDGVSASAIDVETAHSEYRLRRGRFERRQKPSPFFDSLCEGGYA